MQGCNLPDDVCRPQGAQKSAAFGHVERPIDHQQDEPTHLAFDDHRRARSVSSDSTPASQTFERWRCEQREQPNTFEGGDHIARYIGFPICDSQHPEAQRDGERQQGSENDKCG